MMKKLIKEDNINILDSRSNMKDALERVEQQAVFGLNYNNQPKETLNIFCTILDIIDNAKREENWSNNYDE